MRVPFRPFGLPSKPITTKTLLSKVVSQSKVINKQAHQLEIAGLEKQLVIEKNLASNFSTHAQLHYEGMLGFPEALKSAQQTMDNHNIRINDLQQQINARKQLLGSM